MVRYLSGKRKNCCDQAVSVRSSLRVAFSVLNTYHTLLENTCHETIKDAGVVINKEIGDYG